MSAKPFLFLDTDFVSDIYGPKTFDALGGDDVLDILSRSYNLRMTSTVLDELLYGTTKGYDRTTWIDLNPAKIYIYRTPEFDALRKRDPTQKDAGEQSIASVVDPDFEHIVFSEDFGNTPGKTRHYDPSLPVLGDPNTLVIASRDRRFFKTQPCGANAVPTVEFLRRSLIEGRVDMDSYTLIHENSGGGVIGHGAADKLPTAGLVWLETTEAIEFPDGSTLYTYEDDDPLSVMAHDNPIIWQALLERDEDWHSTEKPDYRITDPHAPAFEES